jgi:hypothetical protein
MMIDVMVGDGVARRIRSEERQPRIRRQVWVTSIGRSSKFDDVHLRD